MANDHRSEETPVLYSKMMARKLRTEDEIYDNGNNQKQPSFREKYIIHNLRPFNEDKFALLVLYTSLSIVFCKVLYANKEIIFNIFELATRLVNKVIVDGGLVNIPTDLIHVWATLTQFNWLLIPALIGITTTIVTWRTIYLDSNIPGVQPPSPFSANRPQEQSRKWYHLGYLMSIYFGIVVFLLLFLSWGRLFG